ncbi:MAG: hypothetical protein LBE61_00280 [Burkholderiaceae bacterium]|jgi:hypothetical protein|nr:hypothetical protein [Burkholderiaceae bacterium]
MIRPWKLPPMDDPLGRHWRQPKGLRDRVDLYETHGAIAESDWYGLPRYESTLPSGVYPGKAWRCGKYLCWYGPDIAGKCRIVSLRALIQTDTQRAQAQEG